MGAEPVEIVKFILFGLIWLFPIGVVVSVLSLAAADAKARKEDLGPNVVPFPTPPAAKATTKPSWRERLKRLAFPRAKG